MFVAIQLNSKADVEQNLAELKLQLAQLPTTRPMLVVLPECFALFDAGETAQLEFARNAQHLVVLNKLARLCLQYDIWLVAGTMPVAVGDKYYAASHLLNNQGDIVCQYNKIHLFDVTVNDSTQTYLESKYTEPGKHLEVVDTPFGKLGLAVCYDIRFAGLFNALRDLGAELIVLPAAFTVPTGQAHWQPLLQARAIENQVYLIAAATVGCHARGRMTYGHSMIINPWGEIVAQITDTVGNIVYLADMQQVTAIRKKMPIGDHSKFKYEFKND